MTGEMKDALEAARRIKEQRENPVNLDLFIQDATTVARALLSTDKAVGELREALKAILSHATKALPLRYRS